MSCVCALTVPIDFLLFPVCYASHLAGSCCLEPRVGMLNVSCLWLGSKAHSSVDSCQRLAPNRSFVTARNLAATLPTARQPP